MEKHRLLIVGAGRIGAGFNWDDPGYTHAGAARALADRVELVGFVEPHGERRRQAQRWGARVYDLLSDALEDCDPDIISICTPPNDRQEPICACLAAGVKGLWIEKPLSGHSATCAQMIAKDIAAAGVKANVNYLRRADLAHQFIARHHHSGTLEVWAKDDIHTRCHFEDLRRWWRCKLIYNVIDGPCRYRYTYPYLKVAFFDNGGVNPAECMKGMLGNLLDAVEGEAKLWSPPY